MTYAQYQQLQAFAKKRIADKLAEIQPRAGNLVSVVGDGIAIEPPRPDPVIAKTPTWVLTLYTRYRAQRVNEEWGDWSSWSITAWEPRDRPFFNGEPDWFFYRLINEGGETIVLRNLEIDFQIRISETDNFYGSIWPTTPFEEAKYLYPINLVVEEAVDLENRIVVKTYSLTLKQAGQKRIFTPYEPRKIYSVRPIAFQRL